MLTHHLRFALRSLSSRPVFTLVAVLSLGFGLGLNTAIFTVVNTILLDRLAMEEPERLVEVYTGATREIPYLTTSYPDLLDLRAQTDAFEELAGHAFVRGILAGDGPPVLVTGEVVTDNYFRTLGVAPRLGRFFLPEENDTEATHPVLVASHGLWQRHLGGEAEAVGATLRISGTEYIVVGVAPREFTGTLPGIVPQFWTPLAMESRLRFSGVQFDTAEGEEGTRLTRRGLRWLFVVGRLAPGASVEEARGQVETVSARLSEAYPETNEKLTMSVLSRKGVRFHPMIDGVLSRASAVLLVAVGLVLLIACANVANMLLARAQARRREIALRLAVGASRGQLVAQLMTESAVLATLGALCGIALATLAARAVSTFELPLPVPVAFAYELDTTVLAYAIGLSAATAVLFGLAPALRASRPNVVPALKGEASFDGRRPRLSLSGLLVVGQMALSVVLLVAGALLLRGLVEAGRSEMGFEATRIATLSFDLAMNGYTVPEASSFQRTAAERLAGLPDVESVALASRVPLSPDIHMEGVLVPGHHEPGDDPTPIDAVRVGPDYFRAVGIPLLEGRVFDEGDDEGSPRVAVVNRALAAKYWPGRSAVGQRFYPEGFDRESVEIVGVVGDHAVRSVAEQPRPYLHYSAPQTPSALTSFLVRTRGPADGMLAGLRSELLGLEPEIVFVEATTARTIADRTLVPTRLGAALLGSFGVLALVLASVGLYGLIAHSVSRRTREVGLRMAMGARAADVLALVLGQGMRLAFAGIVVGCAAAAGLAGVLSSLLYGVSTVDPLAYAAATVLLLSVAALANLIPAWRAAKVSPMTALRYE